jgi:hypothetical protein
MYGSADLEIMGRGLAVIASDVEGVVTYDELAIAAYILGKISRIFGALAQGHPPTDDTWHDIAVYTKMAQRIRETGSWP